MLLDANLLLYAVDRSSPHHALAAEWLEETLSGDRRVAIPWQTIGAFVRIVTHPRVTKDPLGPGDAWVFVDEWLSLDIVWIPPASARTARILGRLIESTGASANLIPDAMLAALALEHGLAVCSADSDFARFPDVRWINPLAA